MINGVKKSTEEKIIEVFSQYPTIENVILHGSRAKNTYRKGSDIDLVLIGSKLNFEDSLLLENKIDDLLVPYKVDICLYHKIKDLDLLNEIKKWGKTIYKRASPDRV